MRKKKTETVEFRFYEIPQGEYVLGLIGEKWNRVYGHDDPNLHFHNLMEIGVCRKGCGQLKLGDRVVRYQGGYYSIIPENFPHTTISDGEDTNLWEYLFFDVKDVIRDLFPNDFVYQNQMIDAISKTPIILDEMKNPMILKVINSIMDELRNKKAQYQMVIHSYLQILVLEILRHQETFAQGEKTICSSVNMSQIAPALEFINNNFKRNIKIKDISNYVELSETHFRRTFEAYLNMSPLDYLNLVRVQYACDLLKKTNLSMEEVAVECGCATTSTLNRNFKRILGTSPYQWKINPENYEGKLLNYNISARKGWTEE